MARLVRSDKRPATGGMVASNKMASVQKLQMFYHFKLFLFVAVFLLAERINCRQFNIILHHLGQIFFSEMCFPCTSHSMREEATTSIFSATYRPKSAQIFVKISALDIGQEGMVPSAPCIWLCSYAAPGPTPVTNRCNNTGSRVQCPPGAGAGAVAQFGGVSAAPSPAQPAQPSCPQLPVEEGDIGMIAIYRWTRSRLISTVDI